MLKWKFFLICFLFSVAFYAQNEELSKITTLIENKKFDESIRELLVLEKKYPSAIEVKFKLAQVYFWNANEDKAFDKISEIETTVTNEDIINLKIQVQQNRNQFEQVIAICDFGISNYNNPEFYHTQKALAYASLDEIDLALASLSKIEISDSNKSKINYLKKEILNKRKNFISAGYLQTNTISDDFPTWYLGSLEYGRKFKKHTVIGRVNYSYLSEIDAVQFEMDWYPKLSKRNYGFVSLGKSNDILFPNYKISAELFHENKTITASLGGRKLIFDQSDINMLTGHIGYLFQSYKISYRGFLIFQENQDHSFSHLVSFMKKFDEKDTFIQLEFIYGNAPYFYYTTNNFSTLSNYRIGLLSRFKITDSFYMQPNIQYEKEEILPNNFREKINLQVNLIYVF